MSRRHLYMLAGALTALGIIPFLYKVLVLGFPLLPEEVAEIFRVEARVAFAARGGPAKVTLYVPRSEGEYAILTQSFLAPGYGLTTTTTDENRRATFSRRRAEGSQTIYFRAVVQRAATVERAPAVPPPRLVRPRMDEAERAAARALFATVVERSADTETLVALLVRALRQPERGGAAEALLGRSPSASRIARTASRVLRVAGMPARTVHGLALRPDRRDADFDHWLEVYLDGRWQPYELTEGRPGVPEGRMPWWRGPAPLAAVEGGTDVATVVSVNRAFESALHTALDRGRAAESSLIELSTFGLPLHTQAVYKILLVLPVGVFVLVVLRNVIGLRTFGTFMPVLIALAFRQTELLWGLVLFTVILAIGLAVRSYLETLKLLLVPRMGAIVIVVILTMALLSLLSHKLGFERGLSVGLFPIVITSMTIERMSIIWDERGAGEALREAAGSLLVAAICFMVMNLAVIGHLAFVFPELLLVVLAATMMIGRYSGYRLAELARFRVLTERRR